MLKSLLFTSLVCLALGGGALSSPYPEDTIDTYQSFAFGDDPKLFSIGGIYGLDFDYNGGSFYNGRTVIFNNIACADVDSGLVLTDHRFGDNVMPIRVAMYITTIPFYNSVMVEEAGEYNVFKNTHSEVLFLHLIFSSTQYCSTAMISIPLGFRDWVGFNTLSPVKWWIDGYQGPSEDYEQVFFKAKQLDSFSLSFAYDFSDLTFTIDSNLYYREDGDIYSHRTTNDIDLDSNDFVHFFGDGPDRLYRNMEWDNTMLEMSLIELTNFSLNRVPIFSIGSNSYENAYQEGYDAGLNQNINEGGLFSVFISLFAGLSSFLSISLFPGVTIGGIALIFLVIPLTYGIIKLMRGGGG